MMSEKCEAFPKQTGVLQKHNFNNKLDIFLTLVLAEKGIYKYNDKELSEMTEKRFDSFENKQEMYDLLEKQAIIIEDLEKENRELNSIKKFAERNGINIFLIEEAFRKCWKDNKKLIEENEQLRKVCSCLKKENQSLIENIFDIYEKVKWVVR